MLPPNPALSDLNGRATTYVALIPDPSFESNGVARRGWRMVESHNSESRSLGAWTRYRVKSDGMVVME